MNTTTTKSLGWKWMVLGALAGCLVFLGTGCGSPSDINNNSNSNANPPDNRNVSTDLNYYKDVKPILNRSCLSCHSSGGIGPFELTSYEQVKSIKSLVADAVKTKRMPPWQPGDGCQEYVGDSSLSEKEIKTIVDWVESGAKEGDPSEDQSQPPVKPQGISRVDLTLKMNEAFGKFKTPDDYRCFVVDWPKTEKMFITGTQIVPGNLKVVHHVIAVVVGPSEVDKLAKLEAQDPEPGYECYGSPAQGIRVTNLSSWVPGASQIDFPTGAGIPVEPGSKIVLQMHYNVLSGSPEPDQTSISFKIDSKVDKVLKLLPLINPQWPLTQSMKIPAGVSEQKHSFSYDPAVGLLGQSVTKSKPVLIQTANLHMHTRGKSGKIWIKRKDGSQTCLLNIPRWDFNWQGQYRFKTPVLLEPGDQVAIECTFDNSAENQPIIGGKKQKPVDLNWGEGTNDEMCLGGLTFVEQ